MSSTTAPSSLRITLGIVAVILALTVSLEGWNRNAPYVDDDLFISLRYARNLLDGEGLVWNPGERVEGYTSFLHVILLAALGAVGIDLVAAARILGLASVLALATVLAWHLSTEARRRGEAFDPLALSIPWILAVTSGPLMVWARGGLEGPLLALLVTGSTALLAVAGRSTDRRWLVASGAGFGLATLARPDAILFTGLAAVFLSVSLARRGQGVRRGLALFAIPFVAILLVHGAWKLWYYGELLPTTFYAKARGPSSLKTQMGLAYLRAFVGLPPYLLALFLLSVVAAAVRRRIDGVLVYGTGSILVYSAYVVYVGGDYMPAFRLLVPLVPLAALVVASGLRPLLRRWPTPIVAAAAAAVLLACHAQFRPGAFVIDRMDPGAFLGRAVGEHIHDAWPAGSLVALNTAGSTPYYAPHHRYIDMLGVLDPVIARREVTEFRGAWQRTVGHMKGDGGYVLSRRPDYIILGGAEGHGANRGLFLSDVEIAEHDEFRRRYRRRQVRLDVSGYEGYGAYPMTRTGTLVFTYFERTDEPIPSPR